VLRGNLADAPSSVPADPKLMGEDAPSCSVGRSGLAHRPRTWMSGRRRAGAPASGLTPGMRAGYLHSLSWRAPYERGAYFRCPRGGATWNHRAACDAKLPWAVRGACAQWRQGRLSVRNRRSAC
jgi:hypothetical protein